jgi:transportin-1
MPMLLVTSCCFQTRLHALTAAIAQMLETARTSPHFDKYLAFVSTNLQPPSGVNIDAQKYGQARATAAIMLKNDVKAAYKTMPDTTKEYIKSTIIHGLQDSMPVMRALAGNVMTEIVRQGAHHGMAAGPL